MGAFPAQVIVFARCRVLVFDGRSKELSVPYAEHNRFTVDFSSTPQTAVVPLPTGKMPGSWAAETGQTVPTPAGVRRPPGTWRTPLPVLFSSPADLP